MTLRRLTWCCALVLLGCDPSTREESSVSLALATQNGSNLNGSNLNGSNLNGSNLNGDLSAILAAVSFSGVTVGTQTLDRAWLLESMLAGERGGRVYDAYDFVDAELDAVAADGAPVRVKITEVLPPPASDGYWTYRVAHRRADGTWAPLCAEGAAAVAVDGRWDYRQGVPGGGAKVADPSVFTFACEGAAIAKCVAAGYHPWRRLYGTLPLDGHHQACVRLIRADYCGDGRSHTTDGRWVNLYDAVGIQRDDQGWLMEAEWTPDGARCVSVVSRSLLGALCNDSLYTLTCGAPSHFSTGTLLMSETPSGVLNVSL